MQEPQKLSQLERNKAILRKYIPEPAIETIARWVNTFDFKLKIKKARSTKLGDYRSPRDGSNHQITINQNLNKYAFLITLIHEIAHLTNYNKYQHKVKPHGPEWKQEFRVLMRPFMTSSVFPLDVLEQVKSYMENPAASSCADMDLLRVLKRYDEVQGFLLLEDLPEGTIFQTAKKQRFVKGEMRRKRYLCREIASHKLYLFSGLAEVYLPDKPNLLLN